uniref:Uncharacterized protein n=1 Tax=Triticum urartu TaxID=4572 RepID=A0A8R7TIL2_TRIUA
QTLLHISTKPELEARKQRVLHPVPVSLLGSVSLLIGAIFPAVSDDNGGDGEHGEGGVAALARDTDLQRARRRGEAVRGGRRPVVGERGRDGDTDARRRQAVRVQRPHALLLTCSHSLYYIGIGILVKNCSLVHLGSSNLEDEQYSAALPLFLWCFCVRGGVQDLRFPAFF